ncbi:MaoC family dehydratase [Candidatus Uhrbacteria bacterium]|nr:MaoC family dehydratase [Candidatus Uhrbacteria bacterium]
MHSAAQLRYEDIVVGAVYEFERTITNEMVMQFAKFTGDFNPLHTDPFFGAKSQFGNTIVHGMLAASLFSTLIGMHCPGRNAVYMRQTLEFRKPMFCDDTVIVRGSVIAKHDSVHLITMKTEIVKGDEVMVDGEANARVSE